MFSDSEYSRDELLYKVIGDVDLIKKCFISFERCFLANYRGDKVGTDEMIRLIRDIAVLSER